MPYYTCNRKTECDVGRHTARDLECSSPGQPSFVSLGFCKTVSERRMVRGAWWLKKKLEIVIMMRGSMYRRYSCRRYGRQRIRLSTMDGWEVGAVFLCNRLMDVKIEF